MNIQDTVIRRALKYYDDNNDKTSETLKNARYFTTEKTTKDLSRNKITFYNENKIEIFNSEYEIIALYNNTSKLWTWSWSVPLLSKNSTYTSRKILNYGLDLGEKNLALKAELITSRFRISNPIQIDIHCAISSYLSKIPMIYELKFSENQEYENNDNKNFFNIKEIDENIQYVSYYVFLIN
ncbi:MAG: hypothetical protein CMF62_02390 [Magnetococcales bacterium]|nr:hypothetical protein [Magnetococcales bacterium]|tara:strand:+ start:23107 stop:23652 length:546 start_codon:yes stop_codon:yes gene_type:complete